jgi:hypothetical protein
LARLARKCVLTLAIICFTAMATGVTLQLHLLGDAHPHKHDFNNCLICQQLLLMPGKFVSEPEPAIETGGRIEHSVNFHSAICIKQFHLQQFDPRPPPAAF